MKRLYTWILDNYETLVSTLVATVVSVLMATGLVVKEHLPFLIVALLITLILYISIKNYRFGAKLDEIELMLTDVKKRLCGPSTRLLLGTEEFFEALNKVITNTSKLEVTYFTLEPPDEFFGTERGKYWKMLANNFKKFDTFRVRRIITIDSEAKLKWVRKTIEESNNSPNYHLAVLPSMLPFPILNVVIVDRRYAAVFEPHSQSTDTQYIFIDDPRTAEALSLYFSTIWSKAIKLKVAKQIYEEEFKKIEKQFK